MPFYNSQGRRVLLRNKSKAGALGLTNSRVVKKAVRKAKNTLFAKKVLKVVNRKQETKYVAETITIVPGGPSSTQIPSTQVTPGNLQRMVPNLGQGVDEHQRIGDSVSPVRCNAMWTVFLNDFTSNVIDVTLNIVIVTVKGSSNQPALANIPVGQFLRKGDGTNTDPTGFTPIQMLTEVNRYPVNSDHYTLVKWIKRRFCKGAGPVQGAGAGNTSPTAGQGAMVIKHSWKPPALKYSQNADTQPTNHYPCYLIWATSNNATALTGDLAYNLRSEMFYKDA